MVTPLRIVYVEDDPALRGILARILGSLPEIDMLAAVGTAAEALEVVRQQAIDAALLDLALGGDDMTGIELGIAIRGLAPRAGIVLLTQHRLPGFLAKVSADDRKGWSFLLKRAELQPTYLSAALHSSARGLNVVDPDIIDGASAEVEPVAGRLSPRQQEVMALAAQGLDASTIGERLGISPASVRQDLSRAYHVLVPDPPAGADLRTMAVLRYLRETRSFEER